MRFPLEIKRLALLEYQEALFLQKNLRNLRIEKKIPNQLLLLEHPAVFTVGRRNAAEDFLRPADQIEKAGIPIFKTDRGGKITYHAPGQLVGYLIVDIRELGLSIPAFVFKIEELLIRTLESFGIKSERDLDHPGVWIKQNKIAALGLHFDRGVSMHGFALNMNLDLTPYQWIIPCGIHNRGITSMFKELGTKLKRLDVEEILIREINDLLPLEIV